MLTRPTGTELVGLFRNGRDELMDVNSIQCNLNIGRQAESSKIVGKPDYGRRGG